jgi:hypothetical protein
MMVNEAIWHCPGDLPRHWDFPKLMIVAQAIGHSPGDPPEGIFHVLP